MPRRVVPAVNANFEPLEPRAFLSGITDEPPFGSPRLIRHRQHLHHANHVRHVRQAAITTDRADYKPGDVAAISGHGFSRNETVTLQALHTDGSPNTAPEHQPFTARADRHGRFTAAYTVGTDDLNTTLQLTAVGQSSGRVAKVTFTDGTTATTTTLTSSTGPAPSPIRRPDHVVVVMMEDRFDNAIGDTANLPYVNQVAASGLVFSNSQGLNTAAQQGEMNYLGLYSGSTQGVTDDGNNYSFAAPNLASSLNTVAGLSFVGYSESLPADGSQVREAADPVSDPADHPDLYVRNYNPMAMFTNAGPGKTNADVNKRFAEFPTDFSTLPTVSLVVPDTLHSTHGSNEADPYATDPSAYPGLRQAADAWLRQHLDPYLQWAKAHNSLLILTTDESDRQHAGAGLTTIVAGDPRLVVPGTDATAVNHYGLLRTIENMYGLTPLANSATATPFDVNAQGQLAPPGAASAAASVFGQSVTFTARVAPTTGAGTPTGTVQFKVDGANFGSPVSLANGVATSVAISSLAVGNHSVSAVYSSDATYAPSTAVTLTQSVAKASTTTTLSTSATTVTSGQAVTFTAQVAVASPGAATPTGSVTFYDGSAVLGSAALDGSASAAFTTASLSTGSHALTAVYTGDANVNGSTSATVTQTVNPATTLAATATALSSSAPSSVYGQGVAFTARVTSNATGTPSGTVQFVVDGANFGSPVALANGVATSAATGALAIGDHTVIATYSGDASFATSTASALTQTVTRAATATAVRASANPAGAGQSVTFTATIAPVAPGAGTPSGTVQFQIDGPALGSPVTLVNGSATTPAMTFAAGSHQVAAVYSGDANFATSAATAFTETVTASTAVPNDLFTNATFITGSAVTLTGTNANATKEAGEPNHAGNAGGKSVWYTWTAPASGSVTLDTAGSSFDTLLAVYTGSAVSALTQVAANDDSPAGGTATSKLTFNAVAGTVYQIAIDGYGGASGSITLHLNFSAATVPSAPTNVAASDGTATDGVVVTWTAPAGATGYEVWRNTTTSTTGATKITTTDVTNLTYDDTTAAVGTTYYYFVKAKNSAGSSPFSAGDAGYRGTAATGPANNNFVNATLITGSTVTLTGTNANATKEAGEPNHAGNAGGKSVWYTWTAPASGSVTLDTAGSSFDTLLAVYTGSAVSALTQVAANDDSPAGTTATSKVTFKTTANTTYQIAVDGYNGVAGSITLHLNLT